MLRPKRPTTARHLSLVDLGLKSNRTTQVRLGSFPADSAPTQSAIVRAEVIRLHAIRNKKLD